jgi:hypothetical protein
VFIDHAYAQTELKGAVRLHSIIHHVLHDNFNSMLAEQLLLLVLLLLLLLLLTVYIKTISVAICTTDDAQNTSLPSQISWNQQLEREQLEQVQLQQQELQ